MNDGPSEPRSANLFPRVRPEEIPGPDHALPQRQNVDRIKRIATVVEKSAQMLREVAREYSEYVEPDRDGLFRDENSTPWLNLMTAAAVWQKNSEKIVEIHSDGFGDLLLQAVSELMAEEQDRRNAPNN